MDSKLLKILLIAGGAYAVYLYLKQQGLVSSNTFSDSSSLMSYCNSNPTATAVFNSGGATYSATCAQWVAANQQPSTVGTPVGTTQTTTSTGSTATPVTSNATVEAMKQLIGSNSTGFDGWSWAYQQATGKTVTADQFSRILAADIQAGNNGDHSRNITAEQFYGYLGSVGIAGIPLWYNMPFATRRVQ